MQGDVLSEVVSEVLSGDPNWIGSGVVSWSVKLSVNLTCKRDVPGLGGTLLVGLWQSSSTFWFYWF